MFTRLGKFEILRSLGQGAMGEVFLARDPAIGRDVAVKTILETSTVGAEAKDRFAREAQAAGTLNHPGIVTVHEFGEDHGVLYLAMEYVEGDDLHSLLVNRRLSTTELLEVLAQVSEALAYAHRKGVLHRDVKPTNIRVSREDGKRQSKLMDFGIARIAESTLTSTGLLMGTVAYMAPEYVKNGTCDGRADLFAVGVMLYEGLSGQLPFVGDTTATILYRLVNEAPRPLPPSALAGASPALRSVLDRALDKDPDNRYADGDALAAALRAAKDPAWPGEDALTVRMGRPVVPQKSRNAWMMVALVVLALGATGVLVSRRVRRANGAAASPVPVSAAAAAASEVLVPPSAASTSLPVGDEKPIDTSSPPEVAPAPKRAPVEAPSPADAADEDALIPPQTTADPMASQPTAIAAAALIDTDPAKAHAAIMDLLQKHPANAHLHALNLVSLWKEGDGAGWIAAWDQTQAAGVDPNTMLMTPRFMGMVRDERHNPTLPADAEQRLQGAYPSKAQRRMARRR